MGTSEVPPERSRTSEALPDRSPLAATAGPAIDELAVLHELVRMHANVLRRLPLVLAVLAGGVAALVHGRVPDALLAGWCALAVGIECVRALYASRLLARGEQIDPRREHARMTVLAALAGGIDALVAILFFEYLPLLDQAVLGIVLFAIPAAGVAVSMSSRYIIGAFSVMVIVPSCWAWGAQHPSHQVPVMVMGLLYCGLMALVAVESERMLRRSLVIRFERDQVVRELERSNAEVRAAMLRAEQAAQARARVLAAASHDLRQPLHALSIYSAVLAEKPTADTLREVGQNIHQIVRALGSLLTGLLDLSKLSVGYYVADRRVFALHEVIQEVCAEFREPARSRDLRLVEALVPMWVDADAHAVARVARNLIDNALKYTAQGEVRVGLHAEAGEATLVVADTGKGIAPDEQARVFEEFYQIDNPGRDRSRGVGLGLAIVQRLCDLNGYRIALHSAPGRGTTFTVSIAPTVAEPARVDEARREASSHALAGRRVVVVDDEIAIQDSMATLLGLWGLQVETAAGAEAAQALCERGGPPDLMITDLRLGGDEHGAALAERLQARYGRFPVLVISGETSSEALRTANEAGFALLQKPISSERLRSAVDALLLGREAALPGAD
jgi:signal transduction histidine kinase